MLDLSPTAPVGLWHLCALLSFFLQCSWTGASCEGTSALLCSVFFCVSLLCLECRDGWSGCALVKGRACPGSARGCPCISESHSPYKVAEECGSGGLWDQEDRRGAAGGGCSVSALQGELCCCSAWPSSPCRVQPAWPAHGSSFSLPVHSLSWLLCQSGVEGEILSLKPFEFKIPLASGSLDLCSFCPGP